MFSADAARIIGITPKALRAFMRTYKSGTGSGSRYEFSHDDVSNLKKAYWATQATTATQSSTTDTEWDGTPGLSTRLLRDPDSKSRFIAERRERLERMNKRLRKLGLDVPQMSEQALLQNHRAIALAILRGVTE